MQITQDALTTDPWLPGSNADEHARKHQRERRMVLEGKWLDILVHEIESQFSDLRANSVGKPSMARNLARTVVRQVSKLYGTAPSPKNDDADAALVLDDLFGTARLWPKMTRFQQRVNFVNDGLLEIDVVEFGRRKRMGYRNVPMDHVYMEPHDDDQSQIGLLVVAVPRTLTINGKRECRWTRDVYDLRDLDHPSYQVLRKGDGRDIDITGDVIRGADEGLDDANYTWRYTQGDRADLPFMPFSLYHREDSGLLVDPYDGVEALEATKAIAALWTMWNHVVKDASWNQRWVVDAILRGGSLEGTEADNTKHSMVETDPGSVMQFFTEGMKSAQVGQWMAGADPERLEVAIASFERTTAAHFGLSPGDFAHGTTESGRALVVRKEAVREIQKEQRPQFEAGDIETAEKTAAMANVAELVDTPLPEEGWRFAYGTLPLSAEERDAALARVKAVTEALGEDGPRPSPRWIVGEVMGVPKEQAQDIINGWKADHAEEIMGNRPQR